MKASINWLREFVDFSLSPKELSELLTMAGLEVEGFEEFEDDVILDIGITPNRPDCLSIRGIAREIASILELPLKDINTRVTEEEGEGPSIEIEDTDLCSRYASRVIYGVRTGPSPEWITKRLEAHGIRSTCNIVDITNYVLLEMGHPLHAFDLDKLAGKRIVVKPAGSVKSFRTLDKEERELTGEMLMIWDAEKPVAIAGIMGGLDSEVTLSTVNILLESAHFNPLSVRRTSKALNLTTEASYRFERGTDINIVVSALDRAAQLITEIAGGSITRVTDIHPRPYTPPQIRVRPEKVRTLLGIDIDKARIQTFMNRLGIEKRVEGEAIVVEPPSYRIDLQREVDVIEEIARLHGYDKIPATLPSVRMEPPSQNPVQKVIRKIKDSLIKSGLTEVINYSFFNPAVLDRLNLPPDDKRRDFVVIKNPLKKDEAALRTTIVPALLDNVSLNLNRGEASLGFFEISKVFFPWGNKLPNEVLQIAAVYRKDPTPSIWQKGHDGFFDLKGVVENLMEDLGIKDYTFEQEHTSCEPYLHPGKSCLIKVNGQKIGSIGSLHPGVAGALELTGDISLFEIHDLKTLLASIPQMIRYIPLPKYPYVERDISIVVPRDTEVAGIEEAIRGVDSSIIESIRLFDIYTGKPIPNDKKSLTFTIRYRAHDRTLTDSEVDDLHSRIIKRLESTAGAELRH